MSREPARNLAHGTGSGKKGALVALTFKPGELARMVLDILRVASAPLTSREIAAQVMQRRGLDPADARTVHLVGKLVHNAVCRQAADLVEKAGDGTVAAWRVAGDK